MINIWSESALNADPDDQYFNSFAHFTCGSRYYLENTFKEQVNYNSNISRDSFFCISS